ncbi:MAG: septum formation initiator family protein [Defluviitaleaceae bacterium]|nr:septum formation initiator family protein [Defluviitaleaceae bacterium]
MKLIRLLTKMFFMICVLFVFAGIYNQYLLYTQERAIEQELLAQLYQATLINEQLTHELEHLLSDEYVELAARQLGLVRNHEILFIGVD